MISRPIPSSNELLPIIGLGTWKCFDAGSSSAEREPLRGVLQRLSVAGGAVIDSSPMYGRSETVIGDLTGEMNTAAKFFYATKVWTTGETEGIRQMEESFRTMRRKTMDLMQIHNLVDWRTHLKTLRRWKEEGKIRYIGVTHYTVAAQDELERIVRSESIDFVQCNYSIRIRNAERSLLKTAQQRGVAVLINEPFEKGTLFGAVKGKILPEWAAEYGITGWGQLFLKFILSHPAVTCVIPGTSHPQHMEDNMRAGSGLFPDEHAKQKIIELIERL